MAWWRVVLLTIIIVPVLAVYVVTLPFALIHEECLRLLEPF